MIQIEDKLVSIELFDEVFHCHLEKCHGNCCVYGDSGAPLEEGEEKLLDEYREVISEGLREEGNETIAELGAWVVDADGDKVTPLINQGECAYTVFDAGIAFCGIERQYEKKKLPFRKPLSCHLYPVRVSKVGEYTALNYHRWGICDPARKLGKEKKLPVFMFLKESLERAYGEAFYQELEGIYREWKKSQSAL